MELEKLGTKVMTWDKKQATRYYKLSFTDQAACDKLGQPPLSPLVERVTNLPDLQTTLEGRMDKAGKQRLMEEKQTAIATAYGTLPKNQLDDASQKLGINEYIAAQVGDALQILPVGVPDGQKKIRDHHTNTDIDAGFPYHWAGVVAQSGPDYVTLENYARGADDGNKPAPQTETRLYFQMYGSKTSVNAGTKSFHEFWSRYFANALTLAHHK